MIFFFYKNRVEEKADKFKFVSTQVWKQTVQYKKF